MFSEYKKSLLRFTYWFAFLNAILLSIVCYRYLLSMPWIHTVYLSAYGKKLITIIGFISYFSQLALLSTMVGLLLVPLLFLLPWRIFFAAIVMVYAVLVALLVADSFVYSLYHYHLSSAIFAMILQAATSHVFDLSWQENFCVLAIISFIFLVEAAAAYFLWQKIILKKHFMGAGKWIAIYFSLGVYVSYGLIFYTNNLWINRVLVDVDRSLPLFSNMINGLSPSFDRTTERYLVQPEQAQALLNYPAHSLQFSTKQNKLNVVIIAIDTWRFDMMNEQVMPSLTDFSKQAWYFSHHMSGGDSTGPGIFSLFYGLPSTYWTSMEKSKQGPLLIKELLKNHYQVHVISNAELSKPALDQTVFVDVKNIKSEDGLQAPPEVRDTAVTNDFKEMLAQRDKTKPFFTFLFYDAAHSYCQVKNMSGPFQPHIDQCNRFNLSNNTDPTPYLNRYKNVLHLMDQQLQNVFDELKKEHLINNTVVIITGDHGEEFNDNHLNYWGHASNFTHYQIQTPLIVYWPGMKPEHFTYQTSHYDIVPTLLSRLLGCANATKDYSVGVDLLDQHPRSYLIVGSYIDFGVVQSDRITTVLPSGNIETEHPNGAPMQDVKLDVVLMKKIFTDLRRFYQAAYQI